MSSKKKKISSLQKSLNLVTRPINFYLNHLSLHSIIIGIPMITTQAIEKNITDDPEYKKAVTGLMIFHIIMFLQFISRNNNFSNFDKSDRIFYLFFLFALYIVCPSVVIALINLDEIPYTELKIIMILQGIFTLVTGPAIALMAIQPH